MKNKDICEKSIHELRVIARQIGVKSPSSLKKQQLIEAILQIEKGEIKPYFTKMGRPIKSNVGVKKSALTDDDLKEIECILQKAVTDIINVLKSKVDK